MKDYRLFIFKFFFFVALSTIVSCNEKKNFDGYLYPIRENGLYGYIDSVGNRIMEPKFLWVSPFVNGLAMAVVDTIYREVPDSIDFEVNVRDSIFKDYRMLVKYGYIDKTGRFEIKPTLISYVSMPEKGFVVSDMDGCRNALSRHMFHDKRAMYYDTITWKTGYIDTNGKNLIDAKYYYSDYFSNGRAVVKDMVAEPVFYDDMCLNSSRLRCSYIDTLGNTRTEFKYETLTKFNGRRGIGSYTEIIRDSVGNKDGYTIHNDIIDGNGNKIKDLGIWNTFYDYSRDGISVARQVMHLQVYDGMLDSYSFVDEEGHYLQPLEGLSASQIDSLNRCDDILEVLPEDAPIADATCFRDGFAGITPDCERWFVIDKYLIIHGYGKESVFEDFRPFGNGLAAVKRNGKWGYINKRIKEQIPCKYDSCGLVYPFLEEIFEYNIQGNIAKVAYINRNDSLVWENQLPKPVEIKNNYSNKEKKDYGQWTYKYNSILDHMPSWLYGILGALLFVFIVVCAVLLGKTRTKEMAPEVALKTPLRTENVESRKIPQTNNDGIEEPHLFPSVGQYTETIKLAAKSPEDYFDKLSNLRPVLDDSGEPVMSSGNFAVVFKMVDDKGKFHAVRCFHREQEGRGRSYKLICEYLAKVSSPYLLPIKYFEKELFVDSDEYPVLLMDWVEGQTLDKYLRKVIDNEKSLRKLVDNFRQLAIWLLDQPFAHGDLKPDNILVKEDGSLVLVDYDGMFVPAMEGQSARELGSPDFREPSRDRSVFDKNIDNFPIVSILLSLEMIVGKKDYLVRYGAEDRLLFSHDDYLNLRKCSVFKRALISYGYIPELASMLENMAARKICNIDNLKALLKNDNQIDRLKSNSKIERKAYLFMGLYSIMMLILPLYLRSIYGWHIIMLYITLLLLVVLLFLILAFVDIMRPNKKYHIDSTGYEGPTGCLAWFCFIPLLLMIDSVTDWLNDTFPFMKQPYYNGEWYITIMIWICWWYSNAAFISLPQYLLEWRLKHFKTKEEIKEEEIEKELSFIRKEIEKEDKEWEERKKTNRYSPSDDLPF